MVSTMKDAHQLGSSALSGDLLDQDHNRNINCHSSQRIMFAVGIC
jgi:hypothetical protein